MTENRYVFDNAVSVLATDIDPRFIPASELAQLEVARHDVTADAILRLATISSMLGWC
jgi:hypothetical protein